MTVAIMEASAGYDAFEEVASFFWWQVQNDPSLRSRLRRCSSVSGALLVPQVHVLQGKFGQPTPSMEAVARFAMLACGIGQNSGTSLGEWIARTLKANKGAGTSKEWRRSCDGRLDALLRTSNPDIFVRLLGALAARSGACSTKPGGRLPVGPAARAIFAWDHVETRRRAAAKIARDYAAATGY